jgi:cysteine desulfurase
VFGVCVVGFTRSPAEAREPLYFDWNATTPPHPAVVAVMAETAASAWGNPSSVHASGRRAREAVDALRETLAAALDAAPRDVVLTSGGTEANNLALSGAPGLVTSRLEHPSVVRVAEALEELGRPVHWLKVPASGRLDAGTIGIAARGLPPGSWLSVQAASHETGVLQALAELSRAAREAGLRVHVDAVQAFGKLDLPELAAVDRISIAAHKIRGPKGIGALVFRGPPPKPVLVGGAQERGLRPGTVDAVLAAGFRVAIERARGGASRWAVVGPRRDALEQALLDHAEVNGEGPRLPHVTNLSFRGVRGDELVAALDLLGLQVSSGSACSAGTPEPSPVVSAMLGAARARSAIRVSLGEDVTDAQVEFAKQAFFQALGDRTRHPSSVS